jgi:hypothetical protein
VTITNAEQQGLATRADQLTWKAAELEAFAAETEARRQEAERRKIRVCMKCKGTSYEERVDPTWSKERMESELMKRFLKWKAVPVLMVVKENGGRVMPPVMGEGWTYELEGIEPEPPAKPTWRQAPTMEQVRPTREPRNPKKTVMI